MSQHRKMKTLPPLSSDPCRSHSWDLDPVVDQLSWKRSRIHDVGLAQDLMKDLQCGLEQFNDRIIFMSMYSDIVWRENDNTQECVQSSQVSWRSLVILGTWIRKDMVQELF